MVQVDHLIEADEGKYEDRKQICKIFVKLTINDVGFFVKLTINGVGFFVKLAINGVGFL